MRILTFASVAALLTSAAFSSAHAGREVDHLNIRRAGPGAVIDVHTPLPTYQPAGKAQLSPDLTEQIKQDFQWFKADPDGFMRNYPNITPAMAKALWEKDLLGILRVEGQLTGLGHQHPLVDLFFEKTTIPGHHFVGERYAVHNLPEELTPADRVQLIQCVAELLSPATLPAAPQANDDAASNNSAASHASAEDPEAAGLAMLQDRLAQASMNSLEDFDPDVLYAHFVRMLTHVDTDTFLPEAPPTPAASSANNSDDEDAPDEDGGAPNASPPPAGGAAPASAAEPASAAPPARMTTRPAYAVRPTLLDDSGDDDEAGGMLAGGDLPPDTSPIHSPTPSAQGDANLAALRTQLEEIRNALPPQLSDATPRIKQFFLKLAGATSKPTVQAFLEAQLAWQQTPTEFAQAQAVHGQTVEELEAAIVEKEQLLEQNGIPALRAQLRDTQEQGRQLTQQQQALAASSELLEIVQQFLVPPPAADDEEEASPPPADDPDEAPDAEAGGEAGAPPAAGDTAAQKAAQTAQQFEAFWRAYQPLLAKRAQDLAQLLQGLRAQLQQVVQGGSSDTVLEAQIQAADTGLKALQARTKEALQPQFTQWAHKQGSLGAQIQQHTEQLRQIGQARTRQEADLPRLLNNHQNWQSDLQHHTQQHQNATAEVQRLETQAQQAQSNLTQAQATLQDAAQTAQHEHAAFQATHYQAELTRLQTELAAAKAQVASLGNRLPISQSQLQEATEALVNARMQLVQIKTEQRNIGTELQLLQITRMHLAAAQKQGDQATGGAQSGGKDGTQAGGDEQGGTQSPGADAHPTTEAAHWAQQFDAFWRAYQPTLLQKAQAKQDMVQMARARIAEIDAALTQPAPEQGDAAEGAAAGAPDNADALQAERTALEEQAQQLETEAANLAQRTQEHFKDIFYTWVKMPHLVTEQLLAGEKEEQTLEANAQQLHATAGQIEARLNQAEQNVQPAIQQVERRIAFLDSAALRLQAQLDDFAQTGVDRQKAVRSAAQDLLNTPIGRHHIPGGDMLNGLAQAQRALMASLHSQGNPDNPRGVLFLGEQAQALHPSLVNALPKTWQVSALNVQIDGDAGMPPAYQHLRSMLTPDRLTQLERLLKPAVVMGDVAETHIVTHTENSAALDAVVRLMAQMRYDAGQSMPKICVHALNAVQGSMAPESHSMKHIPTGTSGTLSFPTCADVLMQQKGSYNIPVHVPGFTHQTLQALEVGGWTPVRPLKLLDAAHDSTFAGQMTHQTQLLGWMHNARQTLSQVPEPQAAPMANADDEAEKPLTQA